MSTEQTAAIRRLRLFVVILCLSNLLLGGVSYFFLHKIDAAYTELVGQSVPPLDNLRRLTREVAAVQRAGLRLQRVSDPTQTAMQVAVISKGLERSQALELISLDPDSDGKSWVGAALMDRAAEAGRRYRLEGVAFLALARGDNKAELAAFNDSRLRPAYEAYLDAVDAVATAVAKQSKELSAGYSAGAARFGAIVLGVGGWPLVVAVLVLVVVSVVLLVMVLLTRRLASADEP